MAVKNWIKGSRPGPETTVSRADEDALVERCKNGDRDAFDGLCDVCARDLFHFLFRLVSNEQDARDIRQDALLQAWRAIGGFRGDSSFKSWLFQIAIQQRKLWWRRNGKHKHDPLPHGDGFSGKVLGREPEPKPGHALETLETHELAKQLLQQLSPDLREIFLLRESGKLSYNEIAKCLNVTVETVNNKLHRARKQLADAVSKMRETVV
jgi:RNA polymerase sigma-70 factor, ECF subfamily